ncbi:hypothetical protein [Streptomyces sp. 891-h]|uniref:phage tail tube protein n=1 Tax=Streptomyces sp. 891-h TaxID=2720714 RepID=UPI001FA98D13|nr:hypothetical protein [Streptomyces sp. 891-h]UNZ20627.1 hypothetical protein HC362_29745 [Streptomyces sp. 891-h]
MSATPIAAASRYFRRGVTKVYWVPTISAPASPTRVELDAGTDLSDEVAAIDGWEVTSDTVETPALGSLFNGKINGTISADDSSLTLYADKTSSDVRTLLPRGTTGYVVWMDEGDVAGQLMDVFPVQVVSVPKQREMDNPAQIQVNFAVTREPEEDVTIP